MATCFGRYTEKETSSTTKKEEKRNGN